MDLVASEARGEAGPERSLPSATSAAALRAPSPSRHPRMRTRAEAGRVAPARLVARPQRCRTREYSRHPRAGLWAAAEAVAARELGRPLCSGLEPGTRWLPCHAQAPGRLGTRADRLRLACRCRHRMPCPTRARAARRPAGRARSSRPGRPPGRTPRSPSSGARLHEQVRAATGPKRSLCRHSKASIPEAIASCRCAPGFDRRASPGRSSARADLVRQPRRERPTRLHSPASPAGPPGSLVGKRCASGPDCVGHAR